MGAFLLLLTIANVAPLAFSVGHLLRATEDRERWLFVFCVNACTFLALAYLSVLVIHAALAT